MFTNLNIHLLRHLASLVDHQCHELKRLIERIFNCVALTNFDDTNVTRNDLCSGTVIINEDSLAFQYIVRLCVFYVLVEAEAAVRRNNEMSVNSSVTHQFIGG